MEPELPLGLRWPHTIMLQLLMIFLEAAFLLLSDLNPERILGPLSLAAGVLPWQPHPTVERRVWRHPSNSDWWERLVLEQWDDQQWLQNFRMRKATFLELCAWLTPALQRRDTHLRPAIPVEKRVAIAIWKLATPDSYRSVANHFGVGKSTVGALLMEVVRAIKSILLRRFICLRDLDPIVSGFAALGFPNCAGAIDGTHIPIRAPEHRMAKYINTEGYCSMVLQALVDHRGQFTDIYVGWSGNAHDARVFRSSALCRKMKAGTFLPHRELMVGDVKMPVCIVGDAAYPLLPWLMKPYTGHLDPSREQFNARLNCARMQVEYAFGRLKARFRCLLTRLDMGERNIPEVVAACCVLHNILERKGEAFFPEWGSDISREGRTYEQPRTAPIHQAHQAGVHIREALREMFSQEPSNSP